MEPKVPLEEIISLVKEETNSYILQQGRKRQEAIWQRKEPDYLPILLTGQISEREIYPAYNLKEQFFNWEKMLYEQLWLALSTLRAKSDAIPSVRVDFGTGFLATVFGLEQQVFPDKMPWLKEHLTKKDIVNLTPEDLEPIEEKGLMPKCHEYIQYYQEILKDTPVKIYLPDTQGAFDLAHLVLGDSVFTELYDDPEFMQHFLNLTSYVYQQASSLLKSWIGEPEKAGCHSNGLSMAECGVRSCEDSSTLISPDSFNFILPFLRASIRGFGGWVHFCGGGKHILEVTLNSPEVKGVNFGNPEKFDWPVTLGKISSSGKVYYGVVAREEKEGLSDYFRRVLAPLKRKSHLIFCPSLRPEENPAEVIDTWYSVQDEIFLQ